MPATANIARDCREDRSACGAILQEAQKSTTRTRLRRCSLKRILTVCMLNRIASNDSRMAPDRSSHPVPYEGEPQFCSAQPRHNLACGRSAGKPPEARSVRCAARSTSRALKGKRIKGVALEGRDRRWYRAAPPAGTSGNDSKVRWRCNDSRRHPQKGSGVVLTRPLCGFSTC